MVEPPACRALHEIVFEDAEQCPRVKDEGPRLFIQFRPIAILRLPGVGEPCKGRWIPDPFGSALEDDGLPAAIQMDDNLRIEGKIPSPPSVRPGADVKPPVFLSPRVMFSRRSKVESAHPK